MSIYVKTKSPKQLLESINERINKTSIVTWSVDKDGDYTHTAEQWIYRAWIHPIIESDRVVFAIWGRVSEDLSVADYALYHGRFVEMLLAHFDNLCDSIEVSSLASSYDIVKAKPKQTK